MEKDVLRSVQGWYMIKDHVTSLELSKQLYEAEEWLPIKGFEGLYSVSNMGRVMTLKRKNGRGSVREDSVKTMRITKAGYVWVTLSKDDRNTYPSVHRLVAEAWIPNPESKEQVNHKDGNKENNRVENLEWVSRQENIKHAVDNHLMRGKMLELAEAQLLGFTHGRDGYCLEDLVTSMALTKKEWARMKLKFDMSYLTKEDRKEIEKGLL